MLDFDRPLFKRLAHNDTGAAAGHQGGILVPKDLTPYFPQLAKIATPINPTVSERIKAALFVGAVQVGLADTRYQYQTWTGTRTPEYRLTDNLGAIRNVAVRDDFIVRERSLDNPQFYRLTLYQAGTPEYDALQASAGSRRWGPVDTKDKPVEEVEIEAAENAQLGREMAPLTLFDNAAAFTETRVKRIARSKAFKKRLLPLYPHHCAVCGQAHKSSEGLYETEAAHIVPRSLRGADDSRNGLALCRSHHWAFDAGLFGIQADRTIRVSVSASAIPENMPLVHFEGLPIAEPADLSLRPDATALDWHLHNVVRP